MYINYNTNITFFPQATGSVLFLEEYIADNWRLQVTTTNKELCSHYKY